MSSQTRTVRIGVEELAELKRKAARTDALKEAAKSGPQTLEAIEEMGFQRNGVRSILSGAGIFQDGVRGAARVIAEEGARRALDSYEEQVFGA